MNKTRKALIYLLSDFLASFAMWLLFFLVRKKFFQEGEEIFDEKFFAQFVPATVISLYWILLYALSGLYSKPYRKSRFKEFSQVFRTTLFGVLIIFFTVFLSDATYTKSNEELQEFYQNLEYLKIYPKYFFLQLIAISVIRFLISTQTNIRIRKRKIGFPTVIVGSGPEAFRIWKELTTSRRSLGFDIKGFVHVPGATENLFWAKLKHYGDIHRLKDVIASRKIEEVIIAVEQEDHKLIKDVIDDIADTPAYIKIVPGIYDYIVGSVKITHLLGAPLIEIFPQIMKPWEAAVKRGMDIACSVLALLVLSPVFVAIATLIKMDSRGPVFYRQERIGKGGRPFKIVKFRSMRTDAEKFGPALSKDNDPRITRVGKFMRKTRLDELPQFYNVLIGEMSLVGPRPERQYFINQIVKTAPHYKHLHKVRPGITSWGQVKYGYAENVDEMVERLKFDILYIENMSLALDIKILMYTVIIMVEGRGK